MKRTKIIATIGPASQSPEMVAKLIKAGVDVFRLNFSHGDHDTHRKVHRTVRETAAKLGVYTAIMQDLQGPKIRVGELEGKKIELKTRGRVVITTRDVKGGEGLITTTYKHLAKDVKPGDRILLDDGLLELRVSSKRGQDVTCTVVKGGTLREHKGINLPGVNISAPCMTPKDEADLDFGLELGIDFVALSFVRTGNCVKMLRRHLDAKNSDVKIIAKIERPEAVENLDAILSEADGVMVARGDLGVEMNPEKVPLIQKTIIERAGESNKLVITATQMLESMINNPRPTRAEASDVANAVLDGTGAVMLSGETAMGSYPVETVSMMAKIVAEAEVRLTGRGFRCNHEEKDPHTHPAAKSFTEAIAHAAARAAEEVGAKAILTFTQTGNTALLVSKYRPRPIIIGGTLLENVARRMSMLWGVTPMLFDKVYNAEELVHYVDEQLLRTKLVKPGDLVVITFGVPVGKPGTSDLIKIHRMGSGVD